MKSSTIFGLLGIALALGTSGCYASAGFRATATVPVVYVEEPPPAAVVVTTAPPPPVVVVQPRPAPYCHTCNYPPPPPPCYRRGYCR